WSAEFLDTWPVELRLLRAMLKPKEKTIGPALSRLTAYPLDYVGERANSRLGVGPQASALAEFQAAAGSRSPSGEPARSIVHTGDDVAVLCAHARKHFGYQQWILFDDWGAGAKATLASSLPRYAGGWAPFPPQAAPRRRGPRTEG